MASSACGRPPRSVRVAPATAYQRKDHYHQRAKNEGLRSRAAYKLEELQRAHRLLRPGQRVADLGCWPGGWLQVAAGITGPQGKLVGVDLAALDPPIADPQVVALVADLTDAGIGERVREALGGHADVLLSDAAPKLTGIRATDRAREGALLEAIEALVPELLAPGGTLLLKLLECPEAQQVVERLRSHFGKSKGVKPKATRKGSSERYWLGLDYRP